MFLKGEYGKRKAKKRKKKTRKKKKEEEKKRINCLSVGGVL